MFTFEIENERFNRKIKKFLRTSNLSTELAIKKIAFDLLSNIIRPEPTGRHPV